MPRGHFKAPNRTTGKFTNFNKKGDRRKSNVAGFAEASRNAKSHFFKLRCSNEGVILICLRGRNRLEPSKKLRQNTARIESG